MDKYYSVSKNHEKEVVIERSRFIAACAPVKTEEEAKAFVYAVKKKHSAATHNCYAYIVERGSVARFSDDGEPQGTAGQPILEVIKNKKLCDTAVVVTRYFGGIKLGAGGLVRAYSQGAKEVIDKSGTVENVLSSVYFIKMNYDLYSVFLKISDKTKCTVISTDFEDLVKIKVAVPISDDNFPLEILDKTNGKVEPKKIGEDFIVY